jgi:site-specific DNA-adenine methylase
MKYKPLIERFPGSKRKHLSIPGIIPMHDVEATLEPFAGSGAFTLAMLQNRRAKKGYLGEKDQSLFSVYCAWQNPRTHKSIYDVLHVWQNRFAETQLIPKFNTELGRFEYAAPTANVDEVWEALKTAFEMGSPSACLALRKLTFGGVVRESNSGNLNIKWTQGQMDAFLHWQYEFPPVVSISLSTDCIDAIIACKQGNHKSVAAWIDPPYYLPKDEYGRMVPCYPGHKPHDESTLELALDALTGATGLMPTLSHLVYTNYSSKKHDEEVNRTLKLMGFDTVTFIDNGRLDKMNNNPTEISVDAREGIWIAQRSELINQKQLELLQA